MSDPVGGVPPEAEFERHLLGVAFPIAREDLTRRARSNGAPDEVVARIGSLPQREFRSLDEVRQAYDQTTRS